MPLDFHTGRDVHRLDGAADDARADDGREPAVVSVEADRDVLVARRRRNVGHGVRFARLHEREEALELGASPEGRAEGTVGLRGSGVNVFAAMETLGPLDKRSGARAVREYSRRRDAPQYPGSS